MIQIYPAPGKDNRWIVEISFFGLPTSWGHEKKEFDNWNAVIEYVNHCHRKERHLRFLGRVHSFFTRKADNG